MPTSATVPARTSWAGIPPEDRRAARRERLLDAGFDLLGTEGYEATTVRAVCQAAQLNPRYFYESFENLDALIVAVYDRTVAELSATVREGALDIDDAAERMHAVVDRVVHFVDEDRRRGRILYVEALGNEALNRRRVEANRALVESMVEDAANRYGRPPAQEPVGRIAAAVLVGGFGELLAQWLAGHIDATEQQLVDDAATLLQGLTEIAGRIASSRPPAGKRRR